MSKYKTIVVLSLSASLLMIGVGMIVALLPQRVFAATGSLHSVGMIAAVFAVAYLLAQLPFGILSDRFGAKPLLVVGYGFCGVAGVVFFAARNIDAIFLGRVIQGIGEAPIWALGPAVLALTYPNAKGWAIGIYNAAIHAGLTLGPLLTLLVAPSGEGTLPFLIFAILCFTGGVVIWAFLPKQHRPVTDEEVRVGVRSFLGVITQRRPVVILIGISLYGACYGLFVSVLPVSLKILNGFDARSIVFLFVVFYLAISVSQLLGGPLSDRYGRNVFMTGGLVFAAAGMGTFLWVPGLWAYAPLALASLGLGVFCVASLAALTECVTARHKGAISGSYYLFWALGYFLGPLAISYLATFSPGLGYYLLAVVLALHAVVLWRVRE